MIFPRSDVDLTWHVYQPRRLRRAWVKTHTVAAKDWATSRLDGSKQSLNTWFVDPDDIRSILSHARVAGLVVEPAPLCEICKGPADRYYENSPLCVRHDPDYEPDPENPESGEDLIRLYFRDD